MRVDKLKKPIRFVMLGGFLGAGKTTALLRLAHHYASRNLRVGIITNDQAEGLVDTLTFREAGLATEEIPSGCFCCHFEKLLEASGRLADGLHPDVILAEPVGVARTWSTRSSRRCASSTRIVFPLRRMRWCWIPSERWTH